MPRRAEIFWSWIPNFSGKINVEKDEITEEIKELFKELGIGDVNVNLSSEIGKMVISVTRKATCSDGKNKIAEIYLFEDGMIGVNPIGVEGEKKEKIAKGLINLFKKITGHEHKFHRGKIIYVKHEISADSEIISPPYEDFLGKCLEYLENDVKKRIVLFGPFYKVSPTKAIGIAEYFYSFSRRKGFENYAQKFQDFKNFFQNIKMNFHPAEAIMDIVGNAFGICGDVYRVKFDIMLLLQSYFNLEFCFLFFVWMCIILKKFVKMIGPTTTLPP